MTKILIIGYGTVGKAIHKIFNSPDFNVKIVDIAINDSKDIADPNFIFICVPTPLDKNDKCDDSLVISYCVDFHKKYPEAVLIIKSTIPPSTVSLLLSITKNIIISPEFLTENNWGNDILHPNLIVSGCDDYLTNAKYYNLLNLSKCTIKKYFWCKPLEASLFKYIANSFLATKVVYMHQMEQFASSLGISWTTLKNLMHQDGRFGDTHTNSPGKDGYGYSGKCFPKDVQALITESNEKLSLLKHVSSENKKLVKSNKNQFK